MRRKPRKIFFLYSHLECRITQASFKSIMLPWFCLDCGDEALQCSPQPDNTQPCLPALPTRALRAPCSRNQGPQGERAWLLPQHGFGMWPGHAPGTWMLGSICKFHNSDTPLAPRPVKWAPGLSSEVRSSHHLSEALRGLFN